jgi:RHS repeat-associated protein
MLDLAEVDGVLQETVQGATRIRGSTGFGRRIQKSSSSSTTTYLYDGTNSVEERDVTGTLVARYTQGKGIDEPLATVRGGASYYYDQDGLNSVTTLTGSTGTVGNSYTYDAFGNISASTGSTGNSYTYTGRDVDSETGLRYYRARYYNPQIGEFISEDPLRFSAGADFYSYVRNSPMNLSDPTGQNIICPSFLPWCKPPVPPKHCEHAKNCQMSIRCATTPNTHGQLHCTVTIQDGDDYKDFDGEPSGNIILSRLTVAPPSDGDTPGSDYFLKGIAVSCDCAQKEADAINATILPYDFVLFNSNSAAAMMAGACGVFPAWPSRVHGVGGGRGSPIPID